jgi:hypothetical protein
MNLVRHVIEGVHGRRLVVRRAEHRGWEVSEETDGAVLRAVHCDDWHRVERMMHVFEWSTRQATPDRSRHS